jgi:hypothetical protein
LWCGLVTLEILAVTSLPADAEKSLPVTMLDRAIGKAVSGTGPGGTQVMREGQFVLKFSSPGL